MNAKKKIVLAYEKKPFQIFITAVVTFAMCFSLFPLFITIINSMKLEDEVAKNVFAFPTSNIFKAIGTNYKLAWEAVDVFFIKTIIVALIGGFLITLAGAIVAYIISFKQFYFKRAIFFLFIAVLLVPSIIGYPILITLVRDKLGLPDTYFGFLLPMVGGCQVGSMFLLRTFFSQQPMSLYEAARIEGANDFKIFTRITVPLALPMLLYQFIGSFSGVYNEYLWASLILDKNLTMMTKMYALVDTQQIKYGAMYAMYIISSLPLIVTTAISMRKFSSGEFASGMKL